MRQLRYGVAMSLDGFIAGPGGEHDWIVPDAEMDFAAIWAEFDTLLMGRKTFEVARQRAAAWPDLGHKWVVVSRTLKAEEYPRATVLSGDVAAAVAALKAESGKDIWLFGGGELFRFLLDAGLVDGVDVSLMPVLLGGGVPLVNEGARRRLRLTESRAYKNGMLRLGYAVE